MSELPIEALPLREYYERCVLPFVGPILQQVLKERPDDAVAFVAELCFRSSPGVRRQRIADRASRRDAAVAAAQAEQQRQIEELEAEAAKPPAKPTKK